MKNVSILLICLSCILLVSCKKTGPEVLFDGKDLEKWVVSGNAQIDQEILKLTGADARVILKKGKYKNFTLSMQVMCSQKAKGAVLFHTDKNMKKGYRIALNNNDKDPVWWKMTGSLLYVRNLTKSFIKPNQWFKLDITVEGQQIVVNINGIPVVEYTQPADPYRVRTDIESLLGEGKLALISEGEGRLYFNNIVITPIYDKEIKQAIQQQLVNAPDEQNDPIIRLHQEDFPVLDYHVHLKGELTSELAAQQSRNYGINYAIAPNCGIGFPITNDDEVMQFLRQMRGEPFILAMQAEGREWIDTFSPRVRAEFDYVFTDALTFTDNKGRRTRIWIPEETWVEDEQKYMDMLVDRICTVLQEPMDIYVNPCFIPDQLQDRYDELWTEERMNKFVDALAKSGKALEINHRYEIPNQAIIQKAKAAGVKFAFGTNNADSDFGKLEYCIRMKEACGITAEDMYKPNIKL